MWETEAEIFLKYLLWNIQQTTSSLEIICIFPLWSLFANQTVMMWRPFCTIPSRGCSRIENTEHNFRCLSLLARSYCSITHKMECLVTSSNGKSVIKKITVKSNVQQETIYHWDISPTLGYDFEYVPFASWSF